MAGGRGRKGFVIFAIKVNRLFYDLTQLIKDLFFIVAVTSAEQQPGRTPDIALIFFRPLDNLCVFCAVFHFPNSFSARRTARI
jgi:hypothetical protein